MDTRRVPQVLVAFAVAIMASACSSSPSPAEVSATMTVLQTRVSALETRTTTQPRAGDAAPPVAVHPAPGRPTDSSARPTSPSVAAPTPQPGPSACPSLEEVQAAAQISVQKVGTEPCAFSSQSSSSRSFICPSSFICDVATTSGRMIMADSATGQLTTISGAATLRHRPSYGGDPAMKDGCTFLQKVNAGGGRAKPSGYSC